MKCANRGNGRAGFLPALVGLIPSVDFFAWRYIAFDNLTGADKAIVTDTHAWQEDGTRSDKDIVSKLDTTGQDRTRRDLAAIADCSVMIDGTAGIDNAVFADHRIDIYHRTGVDNRAPPETNRVRNTGGLVYHRLRQNALQRIQSGVNLIIEIGRTDRDDKLRRVAEIGIFEQRIAAQYGYTM